MGTIRKRIGKRGIRWETRARKSSYPTLTKTFSNKSDAQKWSIETERAIDLGSLDLLCFATGACLIHTLGDLLERYLLEISTEKKGYSVEWYRIRSIKRDPVAALPLRTLSSVHIAKYRDKRLESVSSSTVLKELILISHAIETGRREWGLYIHTNPVKSVRKPKQSPSRDRRLNKKENEEERLLSACSQSTNHWLEPLVVVAIETGMRRGELLSLTWDNTHLNE